MNKSIVLFLLLSCPGYGQYLSNGSFEGPRGMSIPPPGWFACKEYSTPDTQPTLDNWNFTKPASDGSTYMTLVMRGQLGYVNDNLTEASGTKLSQSLIAFTCYDFQIDLATFLGATFNTGFEVISYETPGRLMVWGGTSECAKSEKLWISPTISTEEWATFKFQISPSQTFSYILLEAQYGDEAIKKYGNIMIDNLKITKSDFGFVDKEKLICEGTAASLDAPMGADQIKWWNESFESHLTIIEPGKYWAYISKESCTILDTISVEVIAPIKFDLGKDTSLCSGDFLTFNIVAPHAEFHWSDGITLPNRSISEAGEYWIKIKNQCEEFYDDVKVTYRSECCQVSMPNIFTPNGDEFNNQFEFSTESSIISYNLSIFNRWGEVIYESNDLKNHWNGTSKNGEINSGVYYWICQIRCSHKDDVLENVFRGDVTLVK